ncbi:UDP-glucose/GDP-mannose dehydrogenase family protein [Candidatus Saccharibacteria bacterium]|nr:MAG: UDP-glucose/GDP-mannose dehydrogenase family protein [Candidatus Saccharibacteria bacterium]
MKIAVIGTGYVGLVSGTCLAELGNNVLCIDNNTEKVAQLEAGKIPIYEPGLEDLVTRNVKEGRLSFAAEISQVSDADVIFLALPTPPGDDGSADLSYVLGVAEELGPILSKDYTVIVNKSTVPVGTVGKVQKLVRKNAKHEVDVVSNPEFLREGQAVNDFLSPDRIVVGASSEKAAEVMRQVYLPLVREQPDRLIVTDPASSETIKYAANGFLATKISFMNALTAFCEATGADIDAVRRGMGTDERIGQHFLFAGPGYGGSCFPKDTLALVKMAQDVGVDLDIVTATVKTNEDQKKRLPKKVQEYYKGDIKGKTFALFGLAFKDDTDDIRESPALVVVDELTALGANVVAFDPQAMDNVKRLYEDNERLTFADDEYAVLKDADALIVATNWKEFSSPDWVKVKQLLKEPVIFDGRNLYDPKAMATRGFYYESMGRQVTHP